MVVRSTSSPNMLGATVIHRVLTARCSLRSVLIAQNRLNEIVENYASKFTKELRIETQAEQRCEWTCLLWMKEHYASQARKSQIGLQQAKEHLGADSANSDSLRSLLMDVQFRNTAAQVYSEFFDGSEEACTIKDFTKCPHLQQRNELLCRGTLANAFMTVLQKATYFAMLERHPEDNGLLNDEYDNVYGIDLTNFKDLEDSLSDGRFEKLLQIVAKRAAEIAGLRSDPSMSYSNLFPSYPR